MLSPACAHSRRAQFRETRKGLGTQDRSYGETHKGHAGRLD